jgi:lactoylglutathione lyase
MKESPVIQETFPIISVPDTGSALRFYRDLLGGRVTYQFPETGPADYLSLDLGPSKLGIGRNPEATEPTNRFALWIYVADCDEAVERLRAGGVTVTVEPADQPWGERTAQVEDFDGNTIHLGQAAG